MEVSLQEKQKYLREHIDKDMYEQFYEYCEREIGEINVHQWKINFIEELVYKFNLYQVQKKQSPKKQHETSYFEYQSSPNEQQNYKAQKMLDEIEQTHSITQSSKVQKSAVDLLDNVFDENVFKSTSSQNLNSSSVSFDEFNFWNENPKKQQKLESRKKSNTQFVSNWQMSQRNYQSPYTDRTKAQQTSPSSTYEMGVNYDLYKVKKKESPYQKKQKVLEIQAEKPTEKLEIQKIKPEQTSKDDKKRWLVEEVGFHEKLSCFKSTIRKNLDSSLNVVIDDHEIIERSFLASNYAMYHIKVIPIGIICKRNYEDFLKFRDNLRKFFPGIHIPYLEPDSWFSGTSAEFIREQKKMLQFFLRDLIRNNEIRNSRVFEDFLMLKDHKLIKRKFQKYDQIEKPKGIEELCLIEGKVEVSITKQQKNYKENIRRYIQKMDDLLYRHQKLCEQLENQYQEISQTYNSLITLITEIEKQTKNFNTKVTIHQIKYLGSIFRVVRETYKEQLSNSKYEYEISTKKISPFLKYQRENMKTLNSLIEIDSRLSRSYEKRIQFQKIDENDSYNSEKAREGKRGIEEESRNIIVLKYQTGYMNKQVCKEGQRVFDEMGLKFLERWQRIGESYLDKNVKSLEYWKTLTKLQKSKFMPKEQILEHGLN